MVEGAEGATAAVSARNESGRGMPLPAHVLASSVVAQSLASNLSEPQPFEVMAIARVASDVSRDTSTTNRPAKPVRVAWQVAVPAACAFANVQPWSVDTERPSKTPAMRVLS